MNTRLVIIRKAIAPWGRAKQLIQAKIEAIDCNRN